MFSSLLKGGNGEDASIPIGRFEIYVFSLFENDYNFFF